MALNTIHDAESNSFTATYHSIFNSFPHPKQGKEDILVQNLVSI